MLQPFGCQPRPYFSRAVARAEAVTMPAFGIKMQLSRNTGIAQGAGHYKGTVAIGIISSGKEEHGGCLFINAQFRCQCTPFSPVEISGVDQHAESRAG